MGDFQHVFETPPEGAATDWTIPQDWAAYTDVEHQTWDTLYARQMKILPGRAAEVFMRGLDALEHDPELTAVTREAEARWFNVDANGRHAPKAHAIH